LVESLPEVNFNLGEMYAGNVPINSADPNRTLFFVYEPTIGAPVDEVTIWLNGGPGCSSMEGFFQENGRFVWQPGTFEPIENPYSWVNLTNMLWVDQPVGTGFATGVANYTTEEAVAQDFIQFFKNFEVLFGISNFKIYITGESYAGRYVPYIAAAMLDEKNTEFFDLSGESS
jgi:carboxypeptidase D